MCNAMNFRNYSKIISLMRGYFQGRRGFIEVPAQSNLSILSVDESCDHTMEEKERIFVKKLHPYSIDYTEGENG